MFEPTQHIAVDISINSVYLHYLHPYCHILVDILVKSHDYKYSSTLAESRAALRTNPNPPQNHHRHRTTTMKRQQQTEATNRDDKQTDPVNRQNGPNPNNPNSTIPPTTPANPSRAKHPTRAHPPTPRGPNPAVRTALQRRKPAGMAAPAGDIQKARVEDGARGFGGGCYYRR